MTATRHAMTSDRLWLRVFVAALVASTSCRAEGPKQAGPLTSLQATFPCRLDLPRISNSVPGLTRAQACALVGAAIHGVAILQPRDGMPQPGDTASVTAASVTEIAQLKFSGDTVDSWWVVTLRVPSRPYDIDVRINKRDSSVESRRVHKPVTDR